MAEPGKLKLSSQGGRCYFDIYPDRGQAPARLLQAHRVACSTPAPSSPHVNMIGLPRWAEVKRVQALLDGWA
jgi:hypothetical protein